MNTYEEIVEWSLTEEAKAVLTPQLQSRYELQSFKVEQCRPQQMRKAYYALKQKRTQGQCPAEPNCWSDNERKMYIWFIILKAEYHRLKEVPITKQDWIDVSRTFFGKRCDFLEFQYLNLLRPQYRVTWQEHEDKLLIQAVKSQRPGKWNQVSRNVFYESNGLIFKSPKHCRERWLNHLDESKVHGKWTDQEDLIIFEYVLEKSKRWSKIVPILRQRRTEHMIKNRYNSLVGKARQNRRQTEREIVQKLLSVRRERIEAGGVMGVREEEPNFDWKREGKEECTVKEQHISPQVKEEAVQSESQKEQIEEEGEGEVQNEYAQRELQQPMAHHVSPEVKQQAGEGEVVYPFMSGGYMGEYNASCYYDYNPMMYMSQMNQCYYPPPFPLAGCPADPPPTNYGQQPLVSKNSSFNPYQNQK